MITTGSFFQNLKSLQLDISEDGSGQIHVDAASYKKALQVLHSFDIIPVLTSEQTYIFVPKPSVEKLRLATAISHVNTAISEAQIRELVSTCRTAFTPISQQVEMTVQQMSEAIKLPQIQQYKDPEILEIMFTRLAATRDNSFLSTLRRFFFQSSFEKQCTEIVSVAKKAKIQRTMHGEMLLEELKQTKPDPEKVRNLLASGADLTRKDSQQKSAFHYATLKGYIQTKVDTAGTQTKAQRIAPVIGSVAAEILAQPVDEVPDTYNDYKIWKGAQGTRRFAVKKLGSGYYSKVYDFHNFKDMQNVVFKQANRKKLEPAQADISNAFGMLSEIGGTWGIQRTPYALVHIKKLSEKKPGVVKEKFGSLETRYQNAYVTLLGKPRTLDQVLIDIHQLLSALQALEENHMLHGDIKPENILVDGELVHLADFGGAMKENDDSINLTDMVAGGKDGPRLATPIYSSFLDLNRSNAAADGGNRTRVVEIEKKRDVFAMGVVLYNIFENESPYRRSSNNLLIGNLREFQNPNIPKEVKDIILEMLELNPNNRVKRSEVLGKFESYLTKSRPDILAKIELLQKKHGYKRSY